MRVVLLGDSIRMSYQPLVAEKLAGRATVIGDEKNGGDSANLLTNFHGTVLRHDPDLVHFNCGLHDIKFEDGRHQVEIGTYKQNLESIVAQLQRDTRARLIWATTTPVIEARHQKNRPFGRYKKDIEAYNASAQQIMESAGIEINDLTAVVREAGIMDCLTEDGVHYNDHGKKLLADAVVARIEKHLS